MVCRIFSPIFLSQNSHICFEHSKRVLKIQRGHFFFVKGYQQCVPTTYVPHNTYTSFEWKRTHEYINSFSSAAAATAAWRLLFSFCRRLTQWKSGNLHRSLTRIIFSKNSSELNRRSLNRWTQSNERFDSEEFFYGKKRWKFRFFWLCAFRRMQSINFFYVWKMSCESDEWKSASNAMLFVKLKQLCMSMTTDSLQDRDLWHVFVLRACLDVCASPDWLWVKLKS